jgi:hypothetical protein
LFYEGQTTQWTRRFLSLHVLFGVACCVIKGEHAVRSCGWPRPHHTGIRSHGEGKGRSAAMLGQEAKTKKTKKTKKTFVCLFACMAMDSNLRGEVVDGEMSLTAAMKAFSKNKE